jgi:hypothetical protein
MWFNVSATTYEYNKNDAQKNRDILEKKMTLKQIAEAQRLAREWMEKHKKK